MEALAAAAIERLPLSPAARLTGAASESASIARAIRFLLAFPGTPCCVTLCDFGPGVVRLREHAANPGGVPRISGRPIRRRSRRRRSSSVCSCPQAAPHICSSPRV